MLKRPIQPIIPLPIKLKHIIRLQPRNIQIRHRRRPNLRLGVQEILQLVILLELILRNQVVEVDQLDGDQILVLGQPVHLLRCLLDVALEVEFELEGGDGLEA